MRRNYYNPNEPANSWEVSYIFAMYRPNINIGLPKRDIFLAVGQERAAQLREWAHDNLSYKWVKNHI
jgi:hypothetical protein